MNTCPGCGKHVSVWQDHTPTEHAMWHRACYLKTAWHIHVPGERNPRPMTDAEKDAHIEWCKKEFGPQWESHSTHGQ